LNRPIGAVLFDLDGTLIDSEPNHFLADRALLARYGVAFTGADQRRYMGAGALEMMRDLTRRHGLGVDPERLAAEKDVVYLEIARDRTEVFPAMRRFLEHAFAAGMPLAVASGSSPEVIRTLVDRVGLAGRFLQLVSASEVAHGKPAPDVFLEAARRLGAEPGACLVVEDSALGVEAAGRAGMRCIAVPGVPEAPLPPAFASADLLYAGGMASFDPDAAWAWVRAQGAAAGA
jgi:HAD superfamily hydrolase (TIGR01509 family)